MENKNVLLALVLMVMVWAGFNLFQSPSSAPSSPEVTPATAISQVSDAAPVAASAPAAAFDPAPDTAAVIRDIVVETDKYQAVFSTAGANLKSLQLNGFRESREAGSGPVSLVDPDLGQPTLNLHGQGDWQFSEGLRFTTNLAEDVLRVGTGDEAQLVFSARGPDGSVVEKIFSFTGDRYDFGLQVRIHNSSEQERQGQIVLTLEQPWDEQHAEQAGRSFVGPSMLIEGKVKKFKDKELQQGPVRIDNGVAWTAFEDKYFIASLIPLERNGEQVVLEMVDNRIANRLLSSGFSLAPGKSREFSYQVFFGPKDLEVLGKVGHDLEKAVNFGFFNILAKPLLAVLKFFHGNLIRNYGFAIIMLTALIKLIFWPLTHKSYKSMRDMQKLQPEMQTLREKFKDDKERMNREIMELYRSKRVNPMGGCLPMFVQIPVFFALYRVLLEAIELRHEPFMFWIADLSAKDPYYITPIIMGGTMFLQQKMSPSTMDPQQAKIFMFLPLVFTFMFLNFPSGLVIYWLVNNVLTILQQWYINRGGKKAVAAS